jgi:glycosyltransferase involved in cell wall biosynthesis
MSHGFKSENLYVIYNSLDYEVQKSFRDEVTKERILEVKEQLFGDHSKPIVICTSRIIKERKLELLFQAVHYLKSEGLDVNILLVGSGPEQLILENLASKLDLQVVFFGECYEEKILSELVMVADATVSPGRMGLTAIHSLAYGTPVITHNNFDQQVPEVEAIIPGANGDFFRQNDYIDLANTIRKWVQTDLPKDILRSNCIQIIEKYYNARYQAKIIEHAVSGLPAPDVLINTAENI